MKIHSPERGFLPTMKDFLALGRSIDKITKILLNDKGKYFFIREKDKEFSTSKGTLKDFNRKKVKIGDETFYILDPVFADLHKKIRRYAQIPPLKDIGLIVTETGMNKNSIVVDAGSGSGSCACLFASIAKKVYSFDNNKDHLKVALRNKEFLGLNNLEIKFLDVNQDIPVKDADIVFLDLPEPHKCLAKVNKALKFGGFFVCYLPCITEVEKLVKSLTGFIHLKTAELIQREWHVEGKKVRPKSQGLMHSGFLVFVRKVKSAL